MMVLGTLLGAGLQEGRVGGILFLWNISFSEHSSPVSHQVKIHIMLRALTYLLVSFLNTNIY